MAKRCGRVVGGVWMGRLMRSRTIMTMMMVMVAVVVVVVVVVVVLYMV